MLKSSKKIKMQLYFSFVFMIISTCLQTFSPLLLREIVQQTISHENSLFAILLYCLLFKMGDSVIQGLKDMTFAEFSAQNEQDISSLLFQHVIGLGMDFHLKKETGKIIRIVSLGSVSFSNLVRIVFFMFLPLILLISF
jgi:ABC-type multidrug transport system fused ATPase/permease subunit